METDLSFVSTDELFAELKKRNSSVVLLSVRVERDGDIRDLRWSGSFTGCMGLVAGAMRRFGDWCVASGDDSGARESEFGVD